MIAKNGLNGKKTFNDIKPTLKVAKIIKKIV